MFKLDEKTWKIVSAFGAIVATISLILFGVNFFATPEEAPIARSYNCDVYTEQGCAKYVIASGGELEVQSGGTLDVQSGATANLNASLSTTGTLTANALVVTTTMDASGAATLNSTLDVDGNISSGTGAITMTDAVNITSTLDVDSTLNADGAATFNSTVDIDGNITSGTGAITVADTLNVTGAADFDSTLVYGTDSLYPLGYASASQQIECGVTATFTDTVAVTASALTTATYVVAIQITDPAATAVFLTVDAPSGNGFNIDSWESDYTVGTTGITAYWCAIGNQ